MSYSFFETLVRLTINDCLHAERELTSLTDCWLFCWWWGLRRWFLPSQSSLCLIEPCFHHCSGRVIGGLIQKTLEISHCFVELLELHVTLGDVEQKGRKRIEPMSFLVLGEGGFVLAVFVVALGFLEMTPRRVFLSRARE